MNNDLYVVLMAGGIGTRFWPYSRHAQPKQFLDVVGTGKTLLQSTLDRFLPLCPAENIFVVTHEEHESLARQQLPQLGADQVLLESARKNTAPCIAYACQKIKKRNANAVVVVSPADHLILNEADFQATILKAAEAARPNDKLITLGITPTRPETGYGYIQFIEGKGPLKKVKTFTEKPEISLAKKFVESGDFVWNAGIFIWGVQAIMSAFAKHLPEMAEVFEEIDDKLFTAGEKQAVAQAYSQSKSISIDYGIMEKADNVYVALSTFAWSDLGSWASLHELAKKDAHNNAIQHDALTYDTRNSVIRGEAGKLIVAQGLNGYLVGSFGNVVIVCEKDKEHLFRQFVNDARQLKNGGEFV